MWSKCSGISPPAVVWHYNRVLEKNTLSLLLQYHSLFSLGGDPSADIRPTSGSLQFITNARRQTISLTILPDDFPEVDEVMCMIQ